LNKSLNYNTNYYLIKKPLTYKQANKENTEINEKSSRLTSMVSLALPTATPRKQSNTGSMAFTSIKSTVSLLSVSNNLNNIQKSAVSVKSTIGEKLEANSSSSEDKKSDLTIQSEFEFEICSMCV